MHFFNLITELSKDKQIELFFDMDGVIASFEFGKPLDFKHKRPLKNNIEVIKKLTSLENVELKILSVCRKDFQIDEKNYWLDENAPFFVKENRNILSKETITGLSSAEMKRDFLKNYNTTKQIVLVDDDVRVLKCISESLDNVILFQDSELVD